MKYATFQLLFTAMSGALEVQSPEPTVVAVDGRPAVLQCLFPLDPGADTTDPDLVVTWQTVVKSRVVHSFYYGRDQLENQSRAFRNRTSVFPSLFVEGNASLRLEAVGLEDEGVYVCSVSNRRGTGKAEVELTYAAYYTEPHLVIQALAVKTTFCYQYEGYPLPKVQWTDSEGSDLKFHTENRTQANGLLSLKAQLEVERRKPVNYIFTVKNPLLKQEIKRTVSFDYASSGPPVIQARTRTTLLFTLILIVIII